MKFTSPLLVLLLSGFAVVFALSPSPHSRSPSNALSHPPIVPHHVRGMVPIHRCKFKHNSTHSTLASTSGSKSSTAASTVTPYPSPPQIATTLKSLNSELLLQIETLNHLTQNPNGMDPGELRKKVMASLQAIQDTIVTTNKVLHSVSQNGGVKSISIPLPSDSSSSSGLSPRSNEMTTESLAQIVNMVSQTVSELLPPALDAVGIMLAFMGFPEVAPVLKALEPLAQELAKVVGKIAVDLLPELAPLGEAVVGFLRSLGVHF